MQTDRNIYLEKRHIIKYPEKNPFYHPSVIYPEYLYKSDFISEERNDVYDMVRSTLIGLRLDEKNYGHEDWNPMGDVIKPGDTILIKPNMVCNYDAIGQYECTLTHPSVVRAVMDYCILAKPGRIILGDAPIQGADWEKIWTDYGYKQLLDFYKKRGRWIEFCDFRRLIVKSEYGVIRETKNNSEENSLTIDLGKISKHFLKGKREFRINCYTGEKVNKYHRETKHEYVITQKALEADVIINLPKPKTHRFAGLTGAQKNFIGICADKESLPHYSKGTPDEGGDETNKKSILQKFATTANMKSLEEGKNGHYQRAGFYMLPYYLYAKVKRETVFWQGAWYGNDTIWRTIIDVNLIIWFASKQGVLDFGRKQRKIFTIGDMILAGEGDGPLNPSPKEWGCILASHNCVAFDYVLCRMAGFEEKHLPIIMNSLAEKRLFPFELEEFKLYSNIKKYDNKGLKELVFSKDFYLKPHPFWKDVLSGSYSSL